MSHARMSEFMDIGRAIDRITNEVGSSLLGKENRIRQGKPQEASKGEYGRRPADFLR